MTNTATWKLFALMAVAVFVAGCVTTSDVYGGEGFGIGAINFGNSPVEQIRVSGVGDDRRQYHAQAGQRPFKGLRPAFPSADHFQDNKRRIPEEVSVSWRDLPAQGQPSYTGTQRGPFVATIRSRIPLEALKKAQARGFFIEIGLEINDGHIVVNWQLVDFEMDKENGQKTVISRGGDSFK